MKPTSLTLAVAITLAAASAASADDQTKAGHEAKVPSVGKTKTGKTESAQEQGKVLLTGSYIKQDIRHNGRMTDGASQVIVLDRDTIERSGATDLRQLLV